MTLVQDVPIGPACWKALLALFCGVSLLGVVPNMFVLWFMYICIRNLRTFEVPETQLQA